MKSTTWKWLFAILLCLVINTSLANTSAWQTLAPGLEYSRLDGFANFPNGYLHAFRVDLKHYHLEIAPLTKDLSSDSAFNQLMALKNAVVAVNGGFFTSQLMPLGLRINQGHQQNPLKPVSWWAVFYVRKQEAGVVKGQSFQSGPNVSFAVEAGPRLVVDNQVVANLKLDLDNRTALGITRAGQVIVLATENLMLSTTDLAALMQRSEKEGGLGCVDAMNLDGGSSTQLYTRLPNFSLQVPSGSQVADAVLVVPGV